MVCREAGFSLMELLVVMAIAGLLFAVTAPNFSQLSDTRDYREAVRQVVSAANSARSSAIKSNQPVDLIFEPDMKRLAVVTAGERLDDKKFVMLPESLEISVTSAAALAPAEGLSVIRFFPAGGASGGDVQLLRASGAGTLIQIGWLLADVKQETI